MRVQGILAGVANLKTVRLTTVGRKSGSERAADVWFVIENDDAVLLQAGEKGQKGWFVNVRANPRVRLRFGDRVVEGTAEVLPASEDERVAALFRGKYWLARVAGWLGSRIGHGRAVRVRLDSPVATAA